MIPSGRGISRENHQYAVFFAKFQYSTFFAKNCQDFENLKNAYHGTLKIWIFFVKLICIHRYLTVRSEMFFFILNTFYDLWFPKCFQKFEGKFQIYIWLKGDLTRLEVSIGIITAGKSSERTRLIPWFGSHSRQIFPVRDC